MKIKTSYPRIRVDFNNADENGRYRLNTIGTFSDLKDLSITLEEGLILTIYQDDDDFEVSARVEFSKKEQIWVADPDWGTRKDLGQLTDL